MILITMGSACFSLVPLQDLELHVNQLWIGYCLCITKLDLED